MQRRSLAFQPRTVEPARTVLEPRQNVSQGMVSVLNVKGIVYASLSIVNDYGDTIQMPSLKQRLSAYADSS